MEWKKLGEEQIKIWKKYRRKENREAVALIILIIIITYEPYQNIFLNTTTTKGNRYSDQWVNSRTVLAIIVGVILVVCIAAFAAYLYIKLRKERKIYLQCFSDGKILYKDTDSNTFCIRIPKEIEQQFTKKKTANIYSDKYNYENYLYKKRKRYL